MDARIDQLTVSAFTIPTDGPESDGTLAWDSTTMVLVEARSGAIQGLGYSYADLSTARLIGDRFTQLVEGQDALSPAAAFESMQRQARNLGRPGIVSMGISAVDAALWDLKARLLEAPLVQLLGAVRGRVPVYGSGGFTSYSLQQLGDQLSAWARDGIGSVKMKVGSRPQEDVRRVRAAREAIGERTELFVDANGAYDRKQAIAMAQQFAEYGVTWFEEPVSSDDLEGLRLVRDRAPPDMEISAGEYGYDAFYFRRMLDAQAVDVLQADATRCGGISGFQQAAVLCRSRCLPLSAHTAPALHLHAGCAAATLRHLEYFHDHARIEQQLFDGAARPVEGSLQPDLDRPGMGLQFKHRDAQRFLVWSSA